MESARFVSLFFLLSLASYTYSLATNDEDLINIYAKTGETVVLPCVTDPYSSTVHQRVWLDAWGNLISLNDRIILTHSIDGIKDKHYSIQRTCSSPTDYFLSISNVNGTDAPFDASMYTCHMVAREPFEIINTRTVVLHVDDE